MRRYILKQQIREFFEVFSAIYQFRNLQRFVYGYFIVVLTLFFSVGINLQAILSSAQESAVSNSALLQRTNYHRSQHGKVTLANAPNLSDVAKLRAEHMRDYDYFAHSYNGVDNQAKYIAEQNGYTMSFWYIGENLYAHSAVVSDPSINNEIVDAWMNSPGHRANVLHDNFRVVGHGWAYAQKSGERGTIVVAIYADKDLTKIHNDTTSAQEEPPTTPEPKQEPTPEPEPDPTPISEPEPKTPIVPEVITQPLDTATDLEESDKNIPSKVASTIQDQTNSTTPETLEDSAQDTESINRDTALSTEPAITQTEELENIQTDSTSVAKKRSRVVAATTTTVASVQESEPVAITTNSLPVTGPSDVMAILAGTSLTGYAMSLLLRYRKSFYL